MKISELLRYKMQVEAIDVQSILASTNLVTSQIKDLMHDPLADSKNLSKLSVSSSINAKSIEKHIISELKRVGTCIESLEPNYIQLSNQIAPKFLSESISQKVTHRPFDNEFEQFVIQLSKKYSDYRQAGCELFPVTEDFTKSLVAFEPLYLYDPNINNLNIVVDRFNESYRHKIRTYDDLKKLPLATLGFVSCVNMFERLDLEIIEGILVDLNTIMSPGSTLLFTFNDCSHWRGAQLVETGVACYQTKELLSLLLEKNSFTDIKFETFKDHMACIEATKSGKLTSIKNSSAIGRVVNINSLT